MNQYLLDTNICIFYLKGLFDLENKLNAVGWENCYLSEITVAELKFGAASSDKPEKRQLVIDGFIKKFPILPISQILDIYANEKTNLKKTGWMISEFDLLIGCTALYYDFVAVTDNIKEFSRIRNIKIENWAVRM